VVTVAARLGDGVILGLLEGDTDPQAEESKPRQVIHMTH
jgi:hypothetical protein